MVVTASWGQNDARGVLGLGVANTTVYDTPQPMAGGFSLYQIQVGYGDFTVPGAMGLDILGNVYTWGSNSVGERGDGTTDTSAHHTPSLVTTLSGISRIIAGLDNTFTALDRSGVLSGWGSNFGGELNTGNRTVQPTPVSVTTGVIDVGMGGSANMAIIKSDHSLHTIGFNNAGQGACAANYGSSTTPNLTFQNVTPGGVTPIKAVMSTNTLYVLMSSGAVWGCGNVANGKLGTIPQIGATGRTNILQAMPGVSGMVDIACTFSTFWMRDSAGDWWGIGSNTDGILGAGITQGTLGSTSTPQLVVMPTGVQIVEMGQNIGTLFCSMIALGSDGLAYTWGNTQRGQRGDATGGTADTAPVSVNGLTDLTHVGGGGQYIFASDVPSPSFGSSFVSIIG